MPTINQPDHLSAADVPDAGPASSRAASAAEKLRAALRAHPGSTSAELAVAAGIGRSTATKLLARWATDNLVARTTTPASGQPGRGPERWSIPNPATPDPITAGEVTDVDHDADRAAHGLDGEPTTAGDRAANPGRELPPEIAAGGTAEASVAAGSDDHAADAAPPNGAPANEAQDDRSEPSVARPHAGLTGGPATGPARTVTGAGRAPRLPAGGLRGLVEDYLREHPDGTFGPSQIGKDLSRSGGAVANALAKLVDAGCAVIAQDKPRRYRLAPAEANPPA